jgi:serine protease
MRVVGILAMVAAVFIGGAATAQDGLAPRRTFAKPEHTSVDRDWSHKITVKLVQGSQVRLRAGRLVTYGDDDLSPIVRLLAQHPEVTVERAFRRPEMVLDDERALAQCLSGNEEGDLNLYYTFGVPYGEDGSHLIDALNAMDIVEIAFPQPAYDVPDFRSDIPPKTPDFREGQLYLKAGPNGVEAKCAWQFPGGRGDNVKITDIEGNWELEHEDLSAVTHDSLNFEPILDWQNHGTAVLGVMVADDNEYGMTGIANHARVGLTPIGVMDLADALNISAGNSVPGDLILIELHSWSPLRDQYVCMEFWQDTFDAIRQCTDLGMIVCEAAGNGDEDFDDPIFEGRFDPRVRDSGAIICGASDPRNGVPAGFSNFGERVNLHGWGWSVWTTGVGDLWHDPEHPDDSRQWYHAYFSGTSSASPIVTGSVAALQGVWKASRGYPMTAEQARDILVRTGTPQAPHWKKIGPLPNLRNAIEHLYMSTPPDGRITSPKADVTIKKGESVYFRGTAKDSDGRVDSYIWTFGTNSGLPDAFGPEPGKVRFNRPGTYRVTLTAYDDTGLPDPYPPQVVVKVQ